MTVTVSPSPLGYGQDLDQRTLIAQQMGCAPADPVDDHDPPRRPSDCRLHLLEGLHAFPVNTEHYVMSKLREIDGHVHQGLLLSAHQRDWLQVEPICPQYGAHPGSGMLHVNVGRLLQRTIDATSGPAAFLPWCERRALPALVLQDQLVRHGVPVSMGAALCVVDFLLGLAQHDRSVLGAGCEAAVYSLAPFDTKSQTPYQCSSSDEQLENLTVRAATRHHPRQAKSNEPNA